MGALGRFTQRNRWGVLAAAIGFLVVAGVLGGNVAQRLSFGGFDDPGSESSAAEAYMDEVFEGGSANFLLLVTANEGAVDLPAVAQEGQALTEALAAEDGVADVVSYWSTGLQGLRSRDGSQALVLARLTGSDDEVRDRIEELSPQYTRSGAETTVRVGGSAEVSRQIGSQVERDLVRAEALSLPVTLILLVLVFGSLVAAGLPLVIGVTSILGTFLILRVLAAVTEVSIFSLNLTTGLGLGLSIDYSLFMLSRYREELRQGREPAVALTQTVATAGRTVLFSAATVAISLSALLLFPLMFLRSFAYAGIAVVALAAVAAVVLLPALLAVLGARVEKLTLFRRSTTSPDGTGFWHALASFVMRRPLPLATGVIVILLVLGTPFLRASFGMPDYRVLPASASSRQVQEEIGANFGSEDFNAFPVVLTGINAEAGAGAVDAYARDLSRVPGVTRVDTVTGSYAGGELVAPAGPTSARFVSEEATWLSVVPAVEPLSSAGEQQIADIRALPSPANAEALAGGPSAQLVDSKHGIFGRAPLAAVLVALVTFALLFVMTGSVLVPLKAIVLNLLSLSATFGAMVWVFQDGNLSGLLGFESTGLIDMSIPILMFCVAFGLSMDYEVFLLSRIKEAYDRTGDNTAAVAMGLERTGRIVTAAAVLLAVVFAAFATSEIVFIKMLGLGLALAVVMDATIIRGILVPAFMRLMGDLNWWAPAFLRRLHRRIGIRESEAAESAAEPGALANWGRATVRDRGTT